MENRPAKVRRHLSAVLLPHFDSLEEGTSQIKLTVGKLSGKCPATKAEGAKTHMNELLLLYVTSCLYSCDLPLTRAYTCLHSDLSSDSALQKAVIKIEIRGSSSKSVLAEAIVCAVDHVPENEPLQTNVDLFSYVKKTKKGVRSSTFPQAGLYALPDSIVTEG